MFYFQKYWDNVNIVEYSFTSWWIMVEHLMYFHTVQAIGFRFENRFWEAIIVLNLCYQLESNSTINICPKGKCFNSDSTVQ